MLTSVFFIRQQQKICTIKTKYETAELRTFEDSSVSIKLHKFSHEPRKAEILFIHSKKETNRLRTKKAAKSEAERIANILVC